MYSPYLFYFVCSLCNFCILLWLWCCSLACTTYTTLRQTQCLCIASNITVVPTTSVGEVGGDEHRILYIVLYSTDLSNAPLHIYSKCCSGPILHAYKLYSKMIPQTTNQVLATEFLPTVVMIHYNSKVVHMIFDHFHVLNNPSHYQLGTSQLLNRKTNKLSKI